MASFTRIFLAFTLVLLAGLAHADSFKIGVAPHTSARVILEQYQPLRLYLEKALGQPVEIITAPDFTEYARRAMNQEYDLAITTGHQARMLSADAHYLPLLTYKADFKAIAVVAGNSPARSARDLKGGTVLGLSPTSLVTLWGLHWLKDEGVKDVAIRHVSAADSVAQLILSGEAVAGFMSTANFSKLAADVQARLRVLDESDAMAGRVYLLNQREAARQKAVDKALWAFAETAEAKKYFETTKLDGYRKLRPKELDKMERYADEVRQVLRKPAK
jgi:phosphonate transport system substrate-binding protein